MSMFSKKQKTRPLPEGCSPQDIVKQSSVCTGETLIGFRQKGSDKLLCAVVVRTEQDIRDFYDTYGLSCP